MTIIMYVVISSFVYHFINIMEDWFERMEQIVIICILAHWIVSWYIQQNRL